MRLLVLSSEYPNPHSVHDTPIVHYYVQEWLRQGHDVRVVHSRSVFPAIFYPIARVMKVFVKQVFKTDFIPFHRLKEMEQQILDGVKVVSIPIFKLFPHVAFSKRIIRRHAMAIRHLCSTDGFVPELIVCHFLNPQLPLISQLKRWYPMARASLVIHEDPAIISDLFGARTKEMLSRVDYLGFRNAAMRARFVAVHGARENLFLCPSGVPPRFVLDAIPPGKFQGPQLRLCFVGMLIPLKNVDILLRAIRDAFPRRDFSLKIIGEGFLRCDLEALASELQLEGCVHFLGRMSREQVQDVLVESDVFVMVSKPEAFGLVYLEAMAKGCLTVGSRGQGIDGVIVDEVNGFLCNPSEIRPLCDALKRIVAMTLDEKIRMASNAISTAHEFTDARVAVSYLAGITHPMAPAE